MNEKMARSSRNAYVELCRFIAAFVIMLHHTRNIGCPRIADGGWIFVEYFFILSGYFMTRHFERTPPSQDAPVEKTALLYTLNKLFRAMPYVILAVFMDAIAFIGRGDVLISQLGDLMMELPVHFLLLNLYGFNHYSINLPLWYLSGMLIAMPLLTFILLKARSFYQYILCWNAPLFLYAYMFVYHDNIQYWDEHWQFNCILRAFAGLMLGSLTYYLSERLKRCAIPQKYDAYLSALEITLFFAIATLALTTDCMSYAMPCVIFSVVSLTITFSGKESMARLLPQWCNALGALSLPMFCLHVPVFHVARWLAADMPSPQRLRIALVAAILLSALILRLNNALFGRWKRQIQSLIRN